MEQSVATKSGGGKRGGLSPDHSLKPPLHEFTVYATVNHIVYTFDEYRNNVTNCSATIAELSNVEIS